MIHRRDPDQNRASTEILVEEYPLRRAALDRAECERRLASEVAEAASRGVSWEKIGQVLGVPAVEARERYGEMPRAS